MYDVAGGDVQWQAGACGVVQRYHAVCGVMLGMSGRAVACNEQRRHPVPSGCVCRCIRWRVAGCASVWWKPATSGGVPAYAAVCSGVRRRAGYEASYGGVRRQEVVWEIYSVAGGGGKWREVSGSGVQR